LTETDAYWSELPAVWVQRRWPSPEDPVLTAWANRDTEGRVNGIVALHADGTLQFLLDQPLHATRMRELMRLVDQCLTRRSSGVRPAVDLEDGDLGASADVTDLRTHRRARGH
jgi:hypothetical protein